MKLLRFKATDVHEYMNFDIDFNTDVNFLIGSNGSGKTTAIKIIQAILAPSIIDILSITFSECQLDIERNGKVSSIKVSRRTNKNELIISYGNEEHKLSFSEQLLREVLYAGRESAKNSSIEIDTLSDNSVFDKISKLPTPIFLGVERKNESSSYSPRAYREAYINESRGRQIVKGLLGNAILETQLMIQDSYKGIRNQEQKQSSVLRDSILKSSFKFSSFNPDDFGSSDKKWLQASQLVSKKKDINRALSKILSVDDSLSSEVNSFFDSLEKLLYELRNSGDDAGFNLNWLMNQAQINRISDLVDIIDSYDSKIEAINKPLSEFVSIINRFFEDSQKSISIDPVGRIIVNINKTRKNLTLDCLSSGERQLLIIIANVLFNKYSHSFSTRKSVIIIDEPELSLHMRWQEMFSDVILNSNPNTQFILATHSPDIVGELTNKCIKVRKVNKI